MRLKARLTRIERLAGECLLQARQQASQSNVIRDVLKLATDPIQHPIKRRAAWELLLQMLRMSGAPSSAIKVASAALDEARGFERGALIAAAEAGDPIHWPVPDYSTKDQTA